MCAMVGAVVLAAGASSRFGSPKQRLLLAPVVRRVRSAHSVDEIVVVVGAHDVDTDARVARCTDWERGPGASLRCGLAALPPGADAAVVVLADGPLLAPEAIERVVEAWQGGAGTVVAASYGGIRGHPVVLDRGMWAQIPDEGARALILAHRGTLELRATDDTGVVRDIDTPSQLKGA